ncbi:hypothetical protein [Deinococcus yavapaiensis]|uniref:Winged helix DNA-binding protein n=1 Tax=Deinococcus yavapaiensis KR-236 TaxID=694435 RepID=A0A318S1L6_9DEIO|nr:hypothetical protein [Deinococcus yavapaiensis]PYE48363.1 hypothetical protein DES52_1306 [Deinococcus yavapaiensis KR-236]
MTHPTSSEFTPVERFVLLDAWRGAPRFYSNVMPSQLTHVIGGSTFTPVQIGKARHALVKRDLLRLRGPSVLLTDKGRRLAKTLTAELAGVVL